MAHPHTPVWPPELQKTHRVLPHTLHLSSTCRTSNPALWSEKLTPFQKRSFKLHILYGGQLNLRQRLLKGAPENEKERPRKIIIHYKLQFQKELRALPTPAQMKTYLIAADTCSVLAAENAPLSRVMWRLFWSVRSTVNITSLPLLPSYITHSLKHKLSRLIAPFLFEGSYGPMEMANVVVHPTSTDNV